MHAVYTDQLSTVSMTKVRINVTANFHIILRKLRKRETATVVGA